MIFNRTSFLWTLINAFLLGFVVFLYAQQGISLIVGILAFLVFLSLTIQLYVKYSVKKNNH